MRGSRRSELVNTNRRLCRTWTALARRGIIDFRHGPIEANPPHAHLGFAKVLYVLEGHYDFRVGDIESSGGPGTVVVVPRGSQHTFTTTGGDVASKSQTSCGTVW